MVMVGNQTCDHDHFVVYKDAKYSAVHSGKEPACLCRRRKRCRFDSQVRKIPLEEGMATHSSILAWNTMDTGAWQDTVHRIQCKELDMTEFLGAPKSLQMVTAAMKLKDAHSLEEKL